MEQSMKEDIQEFLNNYFEKVNKLNTAKLLNDIFESFKTAHTNKHYVLLIETNPDDYFSEEEQNSFSENGYYRTNELEIRARNQFFIPQNNMEIILKALKNESMCIDMNHNSETDETAYIITLNGIKNSQFIVDFKSKLNK